MSKSTPIPRLPDAELDIMLVLWQHDGPSRISEIHDALREIRPCSKPALHNLLDRLAERGFVQIDRIEDKPPYKLFTTLISEKQYRARESSDFVRRLCRGKWQSLIAALVDSEEIGREDLEEISRLLEKKS